MSLNKIIELKGFCADVNIAPMFCANETSSVVNGDIDVAVVSNECNFPCNSSMIVGENFGAPYGLIKGFVNIIKNGNQTVCDSEELKECGDINISLNNEDVISDKCNEREELINTFNVLFNDNEQCVNTENLCVLQTNDELLKVIFNEIYALSDGRVHYGNYTSYKNGFVNL